MRKVHIPALPEVEQKSPMGKFHSFCRNLTLELNGGFRAGTWGGGHPFDLQIRRVPPGEPHQLINSGATDLVVLLVADNPPNVFWHYPDSNKYGLRSPRKIFRATDVDYHDGEE